MHSRKQDQSFSGTPGASARVLEDRKLTAPRSVKKLPEHASFNHATLPTLEVWRQEWDRMGDEGTLPLAAALLPSPDLHTHSLGWGIDE